MTERNPIESIASELVDSIRVGQNASIDPIVDANPEHESELRGLLPVIERLERARKQQTDRPNGLASLGTSRPDRLGDFKLVRQIGRGGMGVVFEAKQQSLDRIVAIKVLPKSLLTDDIQLKRFEQEARTAASLHHTNIVPVFGVGEDQGFHYYVMQRIDGHGLDRLLADEKTSELTSKQIAELGYQAASALAHAHSQNILHRDIKPANLIVNDDNELWVADFGVAKAIESEAVTRTGDVVGTLRYMAPEQIVGMADFRSDGYSLGVTLYELLAGRPAMDDASIREALVSRKPATPPPSLRHVDPTIPRDLETIVHTAMSADPSRRYQDCQTLADDLERFIEGRPISMRRLSFIENGIRWAKRNPAIAALSTLSLFLLICAALISTISQIQLKKLFDREQIARRNSDATAEIAVAALDQVFDRFAATSPDPSKSPSQFASAPAISVEAAELLEDLLPYFDSLASHGKLDPDQELSAQNAQTSLGDIHFQLGHYQRSIESYSLALQRSDGSNDLLREAQIHNRIGFAHRMLGETKSAIEQHHVSIGLLESDPKLDQPPQQFEWARTHFLLALHVQSWMDSSRVPPPLAINIFSSRDRPPPGGLPPGETPPSGQPPHPGQEGPRPEIGANQSNVVHLTAAVDALRKLQKLEPENLSYRLALAASLRQLSGESLTRRSDAQHAHDREALEILRTLNLEQPSNAMVQLELSASLAGFDVFERMSAEDNDRAIARCREAVQHCERLTTSNPNVPTYTSALVHTLFRLGFLLDRVNQEQDEEDTRESNLEARQAFRQAARKHVRLLRSHPDNVGYQAWQAVFWQRYGECSSRDGMLAQAEKSLQQAANRWRQIDKKYAEQDLSTQALPLVYQTLSEVQLRQGKEEEANASLIEAEIRSLILDAN